MGPQRFRAVIAAGPGGRPVIAVPFDPGPPLGRHQIQRMIIGRVLTGLDVR
jgi:hypothetical protein